MGVPLLVFMILLWLGREDLGLKGILTCLLICVVLLLGSAFLHISPYVFIALLALFDITLILILFGGDIRIR
jgi:hypothetical protein